MTEDLRKSLARFDLAVAVVAHETADLVWVSLRELPAVPDAHAPGEHGDRIGLCAELGERLFDLRHRALPVLVHSTAESLRLIDGRRDLPVEQVRRRGRVALVAEP